MSKIDKFLDEFELIKDGELTPLGLAFVMSLSIGIAQIVSERIFELRQKQE